jgi:hypothetical protein
MGAILVAAVMILVWTPPSLAMPAASLLVLPSAVQVHGCHKNYSHDTGRGWHRHDKDCQLLRGVVGRKSRTPTKS